MRPDAGGGVKLDDAEAPIVFAQTMMKPHLIVDVPSSAGSGNHSCTYPRQWVLPQPLPRLKFGAYYAAVRSKEERKSKEKEAWDDKIWDKTKRSLSWQPNQPESWISDYLPLTEN